MAKMILGDGSGAGGHLGKAFSIHPLPARLGGPTCSHTPAMGKPSLWFEWIEGRDLSGCPLNERLQSGWEIRK